ncbi:hypothetical protein DL764_006631 [Monosporascus ibericus]|uniref:DUF6594 domain-containing protein n=1 Tax=Monosporascus ibericus TaxID=155417 RepID=A0A4V1XA12_9PEZI|nr:hypothetical protein DL764_006631 [Monosporascus ibericus]
MASSSRSAPLLPLTNDPSADGGRSRTSFTAGTSRPQKPETLRSRMAQRLSKEDKDFKPGSFYMDDDFHKYSPKGLASMAAQQMFFPNLNHLRKFGWLSSRLQLDYMRELGDMSDELFGLDVDIDEGLLGTTSPPNPGEYSLDFVLIDQRIQQLPKVSEQAHERHYNLAKKKHRLSDELLEVFRYAHDFITVAPDTTFQKFEFLLYSENSCVQKCLVFVSWLAGQPPLSGGYTAYGVRAFEWGVNGLLGLMGCALFLAPVGILYLGSLPPGGLFGVTVAFCLVFVALMVRIERRTGPMLFGVSAYMAVLSVFLSNINQCQQG